MLRNFMRDRGNQIVLGTFLSSFVYCLLVLASVRGTESASFVPVTVGMILAVASLATQIYFIRHIATSIRIETILADLAAEASKTAERVFQSKDIRQRRFPKERWPRHCLRVSTTTAGLWSRRPAATSSRSTWTGFFGSPATMTLLSG